MCQVGRWKVSWAGGQARWVGRLSIHVRGLGRFVGGLGKQAD